MKTDFKNLIKKLSENSFEFIIIGGFAATAYGTSVVTQGFDLCGSRNQIETVYLSPQ